MPSIDERGQAQLVGRIARGERPDLDGLGERWLILARDGLQAIEDGRNPAQAIENAFKKLNGDTAPMRALFYEALGQLDKGTEQPAVGADLSDLGNARFFLTHHSNEIRWCNLLDRGYVWDGARWKFDESREINRRACATVDLLREELTRKADAETDEKKKKAYHSWAKASGMGNHLAAMVSVAKALPEYAFVSVTPDEFDTNPWLFNVQNGTLDLRTAELHPHNQADMCTKIVPIAYDPSAVAPRFMQFLQEVFGPAGKNLIPYINRWTGYILTGCTREQVLAFPYGSGQNGKSTLTSVLEMLLGEYAASTPVEALLSSRGRIPNDIAALQHARLVTTGEPEADQSMAEAMVKRLTGEDTVSARFMGGEWFSFVPKFKIWMQGNHRPRIRGVDDGIWRRIHLIPFNVKIDKPDPELKDRLKSELPGILAWAVQGCLEWQKQGLNPPTEVQDATRHYREEQDILGDFFSEEAKIVTIHPNAVGTAKELYEAYLQWAAPPDENGKPPILDDGDKPLSKRSFGMELSRRGFVPTRVGKERRWSGLALYGNEIQESLKV